MTQLTAIYNALAAIDVTVNGVTPRVFNFDNLKAEIHTAELPCRLLLPMGERLGGEASVISMGGHGSVPWTICDLMLWSPIAQGRGIKEHPGALVAYMEAYVNTMQQHMKLLRSPVTATVEKIRPDAGLFSYPVNTETWYYGVECIVTVRELY
jgi:hypothetical protein